ncbi:hypothetical protein ACL9RI_12510 [Janthinobacterium sp. Mn2066]
MNKTFADYAYDAAEEIAKMSLESQAASLREVELIAHQESSQMRELALAW